MEDSRRLLRVPHLLGRGAARRATSVRTHPSYGYSSQPGKGEREGGQHTLSALLMRGEKPM